MKRYRNSSDELYGMLELMEERFFKWIPSKEYKYYLEESIRLGEEAGRKFKNKDLIEIMKKDQVEVRYRTEERNLNPLYQMKSQICFEKKNRYLDLYMNEIKKQCNSVKRVEPEINLEWLKNLHIAHEFYHFLEFSQDQRTGELLKPVERKGMFRTQKVCLQSVSEIAAHSFAKEYMGADINPKYFDCLYISIENKSYFEKIMNNIETARLLVERSLKNEYD